MSFYGGGSSIVLGPGSFWMVHLPAAAAIQRFAAGHLGTDERPAHTWLFEQRAHPLGFYIIHGSREGGRSVGRNAMGLDSESVVCTTAIILMHQMNEYMLSSTAR
jgi:hypothetical protein